jgi:hypothetical protein
MAEAMQIATQAGPQGNPYYIPSVGAGLRGGAGNMAQAVGGMFGMAPPQIQKAYQMEAIMKEVDASGVEFDKDPVGYAKVASSLMLKNGMRDEALKAIQWAQKWQSEQADMDYKGALGAQANAVAVEKAELMDAKREDLEARAALGQAKVVREKTEAEIMQLEEARKQAREPKEIELIDARIYNLRKSADAAGEKARMATSRMSRESANQMYARLIQDDVSAGILTPQEAQTKLENALFDPMRALMQNAIGTPQAGPATNPRVPSAKAPTMAPVEKPYPAKPEEGVSYKPQPGYSNEKAAMKAWGKYEPDKYEYRVNPTTGKIQRKAK